MGSYYLEGESERRAGGKEENADAYNLIEEMTKNTIVIRRAGGRDTQTNLLPLFFLVYMNFKSRQSHSIITI